ncbi:3-oxoacyl-ACP synthase [Natronobeatus ordinarius]|uniref:3-oxoacyl-ACP synthase n=1 Tax=Natronobeatus ordinarius TaxID=2963433 RepID=UPI0020CDA750|nr:3-oxoacyl-ACP synthase [Natronobeatus ordinarius]
MTAVGLTGYGRYLPDDVLTGEAIAAQSGIPESVVIEKMGVREKRVCPPDEDHVTDMCVAAAERALEDAAIDATDLDLVLYHGSEYKDFVVWSAAANVCERLGAENAYATESHTLCASAPIAIRQVAAQLRAEAVETALLVTASREEELIDYENERSSFMFNFGSGAAAMVLEAEPGSRTRALVHEHAAVTDGSFAHDVIVPAGGSLEPTSEETVAAGRHHLDVPDPEGMKERLAPVSLPNYLEVADRALERSGFDRSALDFVAVTHMKRSFHETLLAELGLDPETDGYYLDEYGHVQSADQVLALEEGRRAGLLEAGDVVCLLAAGTGYTWSASVLTWRG